MIQRGAGINRQGRAQVKAHRRARGSDELRVVQQISATRRLRQEGITPQGLVTKPAATRFLPADLFFENENPMPAAARAARDPSLRANFSAAVAPAGPPPMMAMVCVFISAILTANSSWSVQKRGTFLDDRMKSSSAKMAPVLARYDASGQNGEIIQMAMIIHPRAPFNFAQTLRFILSPPALLNGRQFAPLLDYFVDGEYRRVLELGEQLILYGVREEGQHGKPALRVRILAGPDDDRARRAVAAR